MPLDFIRFTSETEVMKANKAGSYPRFINQDARSGDSRKYTFSLVPISDMYWDRALIGRSGPDMLVSGNRSQLFILGGIFIGPQYDITDNRNYHFITAFCLFFICRNSAYNRQST